VRLLRVVNSAALRGGKRIDSVQQAVARLGMGLLRSLVTGLALEQLFIARSPCLRAHLRRTWTHSVEVAALAQVLAGHCTMLRPELAMLAGLVHEIGALPVLRMAEDLSELPPDTQDVDRVMRKLQPKVGPMILRAWNFQPELIDVPSQWMDFTRSHEGPPDYIDVVTVAALQSHEGRSGRFAAIDRTRSPSFREARPQPRSRRVRARGRAGRLRAEPGGDGGLSRLFFGALAGVWYCQKEELSPPADLSDAGPARP